MPNTYTELRRTVLGTATGTVTFDLTGISGYTDLVLVGYMKPVSGGNNNALLRFNNDSGSNYSATYLAGDGSTASSTRGTNNSGLFVSYGNANGSNEPIFTFNIQNYSNSTTFKTTLNRNNAAGGWTSAIAGLWRNTAAITRLDLVTTNTNFEVGSTFSLYGIANADQGAAKATGGIITEDSQYWYHTFGASGAFVPKQALTCDILQIAGGGSAGYPSYGAGGGGGAGGLVYSSAQSFASATSYAITVGGGGAGVGSGMGTKGTASSTIGGLISITAEGGGAGGGGAAGTAGAAGGNGGSGGGAQAGSQTGGTASAGNAGGKGATDNNRFASGGGGGAGVAGGNGANGAFPTLGGTGGNGSSAYSSWGVVTGTGQNVSGTIYYAGGGAGGADALTAGGFGGGGSGGVTSDVTAGLSNTGGGGGGSATAATTKAGGSGVVIVRYAK